MSNNVVAIKAGDAPALLGRYASVLDRFSGSSVTDSGNLVPCRDLPALRAALNARLAPAALEQTGMAVAVIMGSFKIPNSIDNAEIFVRSMIAELAGYPAHVLEAALSKARRTVDWLPSIAEMVRFCDGLMAEERARLLKVEAMEREYARRSEIEQERAERHRQEQQELARLAPLHEQLRAWYGDLALALESMPEAVEAMATAFEAEAADCEAMLARGDVRMFVALLRCYSTSVFFEWRWQERILRLRELGARLLAVTKPEAGLDKRAAAKSMLAAFDKAEAARIREQSRGAGGRR